MRGMYCYFHCWPKRRQWSRPLYYYAFEMNWVWSFYSCCAAIIHSSAAGRIKVSIFYQILGALSWNSRHTHMATISACKTSSKQGAPFGTSVKLSIFASLNEFTFSSSQHLSWSVNRQHSCCWRNRSPCQRWKTHWYRSYLLMKLESRSQHACHCPKGVQLCIC